MHKSVVECTNDADKGTELFKNKKYLKTERVTPQFLQLLLHFLSNSQIYLTHPPANSIITIRKLMLQFSINPSSD